MYDVTRAGPPMNSGIINTVSCEVYSVPDEFDGPYNNEKRVIGVSLQSKCYEAYCNHKKVDTRERY